MWRRGLLLALTTAFLWGILPLALLVALRGTDAATLSWSRFVVASLSLLLILTVKGRLPRLRALPRDAWALIGIAVIGLAGNYVLYVLGLGASSPTTAQIVSQLGPIFMLFGGVVLFHEPFSRSQRLGVAVLLIGLVFFFNNRLGELLHPRVGFGSGVALNLAGSLIWCVYALSQKRLLRNLEPQQILLLLYGGAAVALLGIASPASIGSMTAVQLVMLVLCGLNTLLAYGALAESLKCWEASRVGAVLAASPLFTYLTIETAARINPALFKSEQLNAASLFGAVCVILGSAACALGGRGEVAQTVPEPASS